MATVPKRQRCESRAAPALEIRVAEDEGLLAWAVVSVICFAIFGADAAGKYHICEPSEAAKPAGGAPPAGDATVEAQPGIELAATSEA